MRRLVAIVIGLAIIGTACGGATRDESGAIVEEGSVGLFSVKVGDCINLPVDGEELFSFDAVACDQPHNAQAFEVFNVVGFGEEFPGEDPILEQADETCLDEFSSFVGIAYADSRYYYTPVFPTAESWEQDDREVICFLIPEVATDTIDQDLRGAAA